MHLRSGSLDSILATVSKPKVFVSIMKSMPCGAVALRGFFMKFRCEMRAVLRLEIPSLHP